MSLCLGNSVCIVSCLGEQFAAVKSEVPMVVSLITVKLYAPWVHSLKEKMIVKVCVKTVQRFNVSVIESAAQDIQQTIIISVAFLTDNQARLISSAKRLAAFLRKTQMRKSLS